MTRKLRIGDYFRLNGVRRYPMTMKVCDAPNGGRHEMGGPIDPTPWCFLITCATVIANDGGAHYRELMAMPVVDLMDTLEIEGYGTYIMVVRPFSETIDILPMERVEILTDERSK